MDEINLGNTIRFWLSGEASGDECDWYDEVRQQLYAQMLGWA
jgi:hypothetical protein